MAFILSVLRETRQGEKRVALAPSVASRLKPLGADVRIETGAGAAATFSDATLADCRIEDDQQTLLGNADIVLAVQPPSVKAVTLMKPGAVLISFIYGETSPDLVRTLRDGKITSFAMEQIPRISRAQAMDALSSQAALAGYYALLLGAVHMPRILPMMTTAVGSLRAAKVLVLGLGVAGLQALATAHRLGAITEGYDVRPETKEQALSLGAKFVETGVDARGEGGYARELTAEEKAKAQTALDKHIVEADMIITTASVPGRPAPKLITAAQIAAMKPGAVIVDLGAEGGGNCEGTRPGETVTAGPATILAPLNVPSMLAQHASELYAKNLFHFVQLIVKDGAVHLDFDDEIVAGTVLTHDGVIRNAAARMAAEATEEKVA
ncbi:NAD(P) transhydrogenase subunit alpha [Agrobacterium vitis]|uniref:proton-translocating NAD(P)(+) transhydrogenase n=2 Tax=Rhizobium/Agrobacterium group TaxID=227290 RepID=B9K3Q7_ALLAM|nr:MULTISPECIES: NAD(P) transhydrogenase subunit alpha [Rhizobium/Agrobacterium group]ACM39505.1 NAD(P) transhydrogenase alpha subunit [Allorhizobium ampelinum S4]MCF1448977.1 NAD(P) transhydrogenase subunit alpha [Allorhizobium ampelinum]MCF1485112.1 NAD(P) transhydrogenase subunit alpha [Allorhizobium ampelinum]MUO31303.1 NAD(P)(+) transhydrogenase (Re/Si-specific) subunit alpha [Agrobacterium vitis]MUO44996.1 NAD(P)(+) transhydrogenase (Re/Si-specific) subunit alpha [Agrobacterium vitis]